MTRHSVAAGTRISGPHAARPLGICVCVCVSVCTHSWLEVGLCEYVWVDPDRSVIHLRHAAWPLAPGGLLNCLVERVDSLNVRIGS